MNRFLKGLGAVALSAVAAAASAQVGLSTGGVEVRGFATLTSSTVDAATYGGGLHRSSDTGQSWARIALPGNARYLTGIAGKAGAYILLTAEEGVFRSTDGGNYTQVMFDPASAVAVAPGASQVVLVGVRGAGVYRSTNGGSTFAATNVATLTSLDVNAIAFHPGDANTAYLVARPDASGNQGGVFRSTDGGQSWAAFTPAPGTRPAQTVTVAPNGTVFVGQLGSDNQGSVHSRAAGAGSWTEPGNTFGGFVSLHVDANNSNKVWAGGRGFGLLSSTSGSAFNYAFNAGGVNLFFTGVNAIATFPGSGVVLKALRGGGVWRSTTGAEPWTRVNFLGADRVLSATGVGGAPNSIVAGLYGGGVWRSDNNGGSWSAFQSGFEFGTSIDSVNPLVSIWSLSSSTTDGTIYAAAGGLGVSNFNNTAPGVFRFNGSLWQGIGSAPQAVNNFVSEPGLPFLTDIPLGVAVSRTNSQVVYAAFISSASPSAVFTRNGASWTGTNPPVAIRQTRSVVTTSNPSRVFALSADDRAAVSTNGGTSYSPVSISQTGFERIRFFALAESPVNATQMVAGTNKGLFRSTDSGNSWTRVAAGTVLLQTAINAVGFRPATGLAFAGDVLGNRYCSNNGGASWVRLQPALQAGINAIQAIGSDVYYLTDGAGLVRETQSC